MGPGGDRDTDVAVTLPVILPQQAGITVDEAWEASLMMVELREITRDNLRAVLKLEVRPEQSTFVASNAISIAQAHFYPGEAWFAAIYADGEPVGFVMLALEHGKPPWVWRFMVSGAHQGRGIGRDAMRLLIAQARALRPDDTDLFLSHVPGEGDAGPFYTGLGFTYTGEIDDGERVMRLSLV